jgi:hypothetical protein
MKDTSEIFASHGFEAFDGPIFLESVALELS